MESLIIYHWAKEWFSRRYYESSLNSQEMPRMLALIDIIIGSTFVVVVSARAFFQDENYHFSATEFLGSFILSFLVWWKILCHHH